MVKQRQHHGGTLYKCVNVLFNRFSGIWPLWAQQGGLQCKLGVGSEVHASQRVSWQAEGRRFLLEEFSICIFRVGMLASWLRNAAERRFDCVWSWYVRCKLIGDGTCWQSGRITSLFSWRDLKEPERLIKVGKFKRASMRKRRQSRSSFCTLCVWNRNCDL